MFLLKEWAKNKTIERLEKELIEAREEYNRLIEMEKNADPDYVESVVYRIMAQAKRLDALKRELEMEMDKVG